MSELVGALARWFAQLTFWIAVAPWEQVLRVRCGRHTRVLGPGFYARIPLLDVVYRQSVRLRSVILCTQSVSTKDGHAVMIAGALQYSVADIGRLYNRLHHAEDTLRNMAAAAIASYVESTLRADLTPLALAVTVSDALHAELQAFGLADVGVSVLEFAFIRTYRLIQDGRWQSHSDPLDTLAKGAAA